MYLGRKKYKVCLTLRDVTDVGLRALPNYPHVNGCLENKIKLYDGGRRCKISSSLVRLERFRSCQFLSCSHYTWILLEVMLLDLPI